MPGGEGGMNPVESQHGLATPVEGGGQPSPAGVLPPALERALVLVENRCTAGSGRRARRILMSLLEPAGAPGGPAPGRWTGSRLTPTGFPVEFGWDSTCHGLRYTVEPGNPGMSPADRLALAVARLRNFGAVPPTKIQRGLAEVMASPSIRFGAWVGVRHRPGGIGFKLYCEIAPGLKPREVARALGRPVRPEAPEWATPVLVGMETDSDAMEVYCHVSGLRPRDLPGLLRPPGLEHRAGELIKGLESVHGWPAYRRLPGSTHGFSYRSDSRGGAVFTLFVFAEDLFQSDREARARLLRMGERRGLEMDFYAALTEPLVTNGSSVTHGLLGITVRRNGTAELSVGVPPPPAERVPSVE